MGKVLGGFYPLHLLLTKKSAGADGAGCILDEGVDAMGVAGTVEVPLALGEVIETLDSTFGCLLKEMF